MEKTLFAATLLVVGLCLGSFVNAAVWRIKNKKDILLGRSECTKCHYQLKWYDLIPVISWFFLLGKCRKCKQPISVQYPMVELGVGAFFVISLAYWPQELNTVNHILQFVIWLISGVSLAMLFVYDLRWMILPDKVVFPLMGLGVASTILHGLDSTSLSAFLYDLLGSLLILSGFYYALFVYSKGKWIGFGDIKLGAALALLICDWQLAVLAFFLANLIGTIVFVPGLVIGKVKRSSHIPFGPFLIVGFIIAGIFGQSIIDWYLTITYAGVNLPISQ